MDRREIITNIYRFNKENSSFTKKKLFSIYQDGHIIEETVQENIEIPLPKTDKELFKSIINDNNYNLEKINSKYTYILEEIIYNSLQISTATSGGNKEHIYVYTKDDNYSMSNQSEFDAFINKFHHKSIIKNQNENSIKLKPIIAIILSFLIYFGIGLLNFLVFEQKVLIIQIIFIVALFAYEIIFKFVLSKKDNFLAYSQLILNGVLFIIGLIIYLLNQDRILIYEAISYLLIYPIIITLVFTIIYTFASNFFNKVFDIIKSEIKKRKLIKNKQGQINLYFPKSSKRVILRILSVVLKIIFISSLVIFLIDTKEHSLPKNIYVLLIVLIPTSALLSYLTRYLMYGICAVCGNEVETSSIEERIRPAYTTSETKYKDHPVKDDTGHILGYITSETEIVTEHPEETVYVEYHCCKNEKCNLYGFEFNKHVSTFLWILFGLW